MKSLSLVVPVYDSPDHARALVAALPELERTAAACGFELVETILVDDGSLRPVPDDLRRSAGPGVSPVVVLRNPRNRGKGFSVRRGALEARGDWVLMSDVDMSTPLVEFARLAERAEDDMVCGCRYGRPGMPLRRRILSWVFQQLVRLAGVDGLRDTQCGFKLFRMSAMRPVFAAQRIERFAFDVEIIRRLRDAGGVLTEVPVSWQGGPRSSLRLLRDAPRMLYDLFRIR